MWPSVTSRPLAGLHLLLADDSDSILLAYGDVLRRAGATVATAPDGEEALRAFDDAARSGEPFAAVLLDYCMPALDGEGATARLRAAGFQGAIVGISADLSAELEDRWRAAGCDRVFCKGQSSEDLVAAVAAACGRAT